MEAFILRFELLDFIFEMLVFRFKIGDAFALVVVELSELEVFKFAFSVHFVGLGFCLDEAEFVPANENANFFLAFALSVVYASGHGLAF